MNILSAAFDFLANMLTKAASTVAAFFMGRGYERYKQMEKDRNNSKKEAKKWANAGNESISDRLRRIAKRKGNS